MIYDFRRNIFKNSTIWLQLLFGFIYWNDIDLSPLTDEITSDRYDNNDLKTLSDLQPILKINESENYVLDEFREFKQVFNLLNDNQVTEDTSNLLEKYKFTEYGENQNQIDKSYDLNLSDYDNTITRDQMNNGILKLTLTLKAGTPKYNLIKK